MHRIVFYFIRSASFDFGYEIWNTRKAKTIEYNANNKSHHYIVEMFTR